MSSKIYLYQRIGNPEWATCDESRFIELSSHRLFATKICYEAAPVVERCTSCDDSGDLVDITGDWRGYCVCPAGEALKNKPAAPPELAELQATIARLEALVNRAINLDFERRETIAKLTAEIERLKGGQGEQFDIAVSALNDIVKVSRMGEKPFEIATLAIGEMSAIASQPAPVSVDMSELREYHAKAISNLKGYADDAGLRDSDIKHYTKRAAFHEEMVALIDKVKELNQ